MLFFRHVAIFFINRATIFLSKTDALFYIYYILKSN